MLNGILISIGAAAMIGFTILLLILIYRKQTAEIRRWAESAGLRVVSLRLCWLWRGPYTLLSTRSQMVYRVEFLDRKDRTLHAYVKCGHWFWGAARDDLDVWWDD